jgi:D-threonate/D-erythronate kinase
VSAMIVGIQADDLTGACDTAAPFAVRGLATLVVVQDGDGHVPAPGSDPGADVLVIDTETREQPAEIARERTRRAGGLLRARQPAVLYKKVDSTLRGQVGAELDGMLDGTGLGTALLAPAFPAQGRTVVDGRLLVHGRPSEETPIARDPTFPRTGASVLALLAAGGVRPAAALSLATLRRGHAAVASQIERFASTGGRALASDADTASDLAVLAETARAATVLVAGSAGLATALARREACAAAGRLAPPRRPLLVVAGSANPVTRGQVSRLGTRAELTVVAPPDDSRDRDPVRRRETVERLAADARNQVERARPGAILLTGGETAIAVLRALDAGGVRLAGQLEPGLALGTLAGGPFDGLVVMTKAGGFGDVDALVRAWQACA